MVGLYNANSYGKNISTVSNTKTDASSNQGGGGGGNFYQGDPGNYEDGKYDIYDESDSSLLIINTPFDPNNIVHLDPTQVESLIASEVSFQESLEEIEDDLEEENEEDNEESKDDTGTIRIQKVNPKHQNNQQKGT